MYRMLFFLPFVVVGACKPTEPIAATDALRVKGLNEIVNGTRQAQEVTLTEGQRLAIGWLHSPGYPPGRFCTGTLIAPRVVMTASHCTAGLGPRDLGFGFGLDPWSARASFKVAEIHEHSGWDAAILILTRPPQETLPELEPIPFNPKTMNSDWHGRLAEGAGYGETRDRNRRGRWFAVVRIVEVWAHEVVVDGEGQRGLCFGDSGGPLLYTDDEGATRVLAVLSRGSNSCVGREWMTRLDAIQGWMQPILLRAANLPATGPVPVADSGDACEDLDYFGRCDGDVMAYCYEGERREKDCGERNQVCAWVSDERGYDCVAEPAATDCGELDYFGRCDGETMVYCYEGERREKDCGALGEVCQWADDRRGYDCVEPEPVDPCQGIDYFGRCDGGAVEYCYEGELRRDDCAQQGQTCEWVDNQRGYDCVDVETQEGCGEVDYFGRCDGRVVEYCYEGSLRREDCGERDQRCGWINNRVGNYCE